MVDSAAQVFHVVIAIHNKVEEIKAVLWIRIQLRIFIHHYAKKLRKLKGQKHRNKCVENDKDYPVSNMDMLDMIT